jgi:hypothetical protein
MTLSAQIDWLCWPQKLTISAVVRASRRWPINRPGRLRRASVSMKPTISCLPHSIQNPSFHVPDNQKLQRHQIHGSDTHISHSRLQHSVVKMKASGICRLLLTAGLCGQAAAGISAPNFVASTKLTQETTVAIQTSSEVSNGSDLITIQDNYEGWVNPEDLTAMPQCVAQQDTSSWLGALTRCTQKRCTAPFLFICAHNQWLTQLSCLSTAFSPDVILEYLPYCGRSVLSKAQLYHWVQNITGRTWLYDVGDANGLDKPSSASLAQGYATVDTTSKAPACLTDAYSSPSMERFKHVLGSCGFTETTRHTGYKARPWEYSEVQHSMISLGFDTVGYDLTGRRIGYGEYFDKACVCAAFTIDPSLEPCSQSGLLDLTKERLWMHATCGASSLPDHWADGLKITGSTYVATEDWHWPKCFEDIPEQVLELSNQCATEACGLDSDGYCEVLPAIERACFCRNVSYDSCGGSCHFFETRIDYVNWLHDLCGNVPDWHGLPDNWRQLAAPTLQDLIPWRWTLPDTASGRSTSNRWQLWSFALVNAVSVFAISLRRGSKDIGRSGSRSSSRMFAIPCFFASISMAAIQFLAYYASTILVQTTPGFEETPALQLVLLWCTMPRFGWIAILPLCIQPFGGLSVSGAVSSLFSEVILQSIASYYIMSTVSYGVQHNFYFRDLHYAERGQLARLMYIGALMWLVVLGLFVIQFVRAMARMKRSAENARADLPSWMRTGPTSNTPQTIEDRLEDHWAQISNVLSEYLAIDTESSSGPSPRRGQTHFTAYGTLLVENKRDEAVSTASFRLYTVVMIGMALLWAAQWIFWIGFITLSCEWYVLLIHELLQT